MKRLCLPVALAALTVPALAEHGVPEEYGYVGIHATQHWFDIGGHVPNPDFDETQLFGAQAGSRLNESLSLQLWLETGEIEFEGSSGEADLDQAFASVRWHYHDSELAGFEPYTGFALGHKSFELTGGDDDATVAGPELGLQRALTDRLILDLGARPTYSFDDERWDGQVYAGLNLVFGKTQAQARVQEASQTASDKAEETVAAATATVTDSDGDGVADASDKCPETAEGAKVDADGCHIMLKESIRETLDVKFDTGGATVSESSMDELERVANGMREYPETRLVIEGHTDSVGAADFNRQLSQRRADAVKAVLVQRFGIAADRIDAVGKGEDAPIADNGTAEGRAKNRRVEAELQASRERVVPR